MDIVTDILTRFPIIAQRSKGAHYFHRVAGLAVINIRQWLGYNCRISRSMQDMKSIIN